MDEMDPLKEFLLKYFMPEKCYDELFLNFNFLHVPCLKIVLGKTLGIWILLGTVLVKLPQIYKLMRAKSAEGLSFTSILFELFSITGSMVFCIAHNFPIGAWGETLFIVIQTLIIGFLIQHFGGNTVRGVGFLAVYCCLVSLLISPLTPMSVVMMIHASNMPAAIVGQLIQAGTNYHNGHTGQLSAISVFLLLAGSLARVFSVLETGDSLMTLTCIIASCCNGIIAGQVLCYWNRGPAAKEKEE
ncbi:mannose-P-dolichol utilization defect 1 protein-like [Megalops cyprinoides]|uniref:mannose-P-dolichol utilization defect 1 protein-like n=1 Tax=Megalops cyprinoides TaxID=118141 RepID=UPI001863E0EC|nr:mannose-P-dolichol utilization defect 1 protein-like [Megalops cyprinoides]